MPGTETNLTRLIVRLPPPLYRALKRESSETAVPMAVLVRQLVAEWERERISKRQEVVG